MDKHLYQDIEKTWELYYGKCMFSLSRNSQGGRRQQFPSFAWVHLLLNFAFQQWLLSPRSISVSLSHTSLLSEWYLGAGISNEFLCWSLCCFMVSLFSTLKLVFALLCTMKAHRTDSSRKKHKLFQTLELDRSSFAHSNPFLLKCIYESVCEKTAK